MLVVRQLGDRVFLLPRAVTQKDEPDTSAQRRRIMSLERNKQTARKLYELLNLGQVDGIGELIAEDYREHDPLPGQGGGREGALDRYSLITTALAPHFTVEDVVAEGDRAVVRWTNAGTHVADFAGIPPTGRTFTINGIDIYRLDDAGRISEHWDVVDQLSMIRQLGLLPEPSAAP
jgi:steroid delta-isomerase-like uncharacterized protein